MKDIAALSDALKVARKRLGMTQQDVARIAGVSTSQVSKLEQRRDDAPTQKQLVKIFAAVKLVYDPASECVVPPRTNIPPTELLDRASEIVAELQTLIVRLRTGFHGPITGLTEEPRQSPQGASAAAQRKAQGSAV